MAAIKNLIKGVSTAIGELLVVGGALGTTYVLGFIKGAEVKPKLKDTVDEIDKKIKEIVEETKTKVTEEEPVTEESEPESEVAEETPTITVSTNQQED